jgi:hypothetical protein
MFIDICNVYDFFVAVVVVAVVTDLVVLII